MIWLHCDNDECEETKFRIETEDGKKHGVSLPYMQVCPFCGEDLS